MISLRPFAAPLLLLAALASADTLAGTRRFAIVVGHNTGAPHRAPLRYAETDAGKMARVLNELAEVAPGDTYLLQGRGTREVEAAVARVSDEIRKTHQSLDRAVLYFYFSGHGERDAVELGKETLRHERLKSLLDGTGADLRVTFIDACRSGGAVQERGAKGVPAFEVALQDELHTRGHAIVTSSARDEISLESAEVGGGFFTSHLVTGLRGAADSSGDRQITLAELYRYAHDRTITGAAAATGAAQHPNYELSLSGQGELVLARLERASAFLLIPDGARRVLVRDTMRDQLIAEWTQGGSLSVAVPPGSYAVTVVTAEENLGGRLRVDEGERRELKLDELRRIDSHLSASAARGALPPVIAPPPHATSDRMELAVIAGSPVGVGILGRVGIETTSGHAITAAAVFGLQQLLYSTQDRVFTANGYLFSARGGYRFLWTFDRFGFWIGGEAAAGILYETGVPYVAGGRQMRPLVAIGPRSGFFYEPTPHLRIGVQGEALVGAPHSPIGVGFGVSWTR